MYREQRHCGAGYFRSSKKAQFSVSGTAGVVQVEPPVVFPSFTERPARGLKRVTE
jgi:hypothetical protein